MKDILKWIICILILAVFFTNKNYLKCENVFKSSIIITNGFIQKAENPSDFYKFLDKFNTDSIFQIGHINFPIKYTIIDIEDKKETDWIKEQDWTMLVLKNSDYVVNRNIDAYEQFVEIEENSAIVKLRGIENGIRIDFIFEKHNGIWILKEWIDSSN